MLYYFKVEPEVLIGLRDQVQGIRAEGIRGEKRGRVAEAILRLAEEPRPTESRKISGRRSPYGIRIGDYRVIYEVQQDVLVVLIIKVAHRREAYRKL